MTAKKNYTVSCMSLDHTLSAIECIDDQLQDLRVKLRTEVQRANLPFRMSAITHFRNVKRNLIDRATSEGTLTKQDINLYLNNADEVMIKK